MALVECFENCIESGKEDCTEDVESTVDDTFSIWLLYEVLDIWYSVLGYYCGEVQKREERLTGHLVGLRKWLSPRRIFGQHLVRCEVFAFLERPSSGERSAFPSAR